MQKNIYLDHNATTPIRPPARDAVIAAMDVIGNASSTHFHGRECRKIIETARRQIASTLDVGNGQIIFNSGATEGNNTILKGFAGKRILVSATEHPSIIESGTIVETIAVDENGLIDLNAFSEQLRNGIPPALVSVMYVNNETGVIQPITDIAKLAKESGALIHSDCVQAYGRIPFTRESLGVDIITISSHKIGGPQGVGALVIAPHIQIPKLLEGGG
ncbi:MAG: aminotransferase class V-fold PLP-dependent enzyme, partial [Pseudomonadota bacterium]